MNNSKAMIGLTLLGLLAISWAAHETEMPFPRIWSYWGQVIVYKMERQASPQCVYYRQQC